MGKRIALEVHHLGLGQPGRPRHGDHVAGVIELEMTDRAIGVGEVGRGDLVAIDRVVVGIDPAVRLRLLHDAPRGVVLVGDEVDAPWPGERRQVAGAVVGVGGDPAFDIGHRDKVPGGVISVGHCSTKVVGRSRDHRGLGCRVVGEP